MNEKLKEYLDSECSDYDMSYEVEYDESNEQYVATISRFDKCVDIIFRINKNQNLKIELSPDSWYETEEFEWTVKYFWMLVAPKLFR